MSGSGLLVPASGLDTTGLFAMYTADAGTSTVVDGVGVSQWDDQSGNGRHMIQGTGANQPLFKAAIQNGKPIVRFDGSNDSMAATIASLSQPFTIFYVAKGSGGRVMGSAGGACRAGVSTSGPDGFAGSSLQGFTDMSLAFNVVTTLFNGASSVHRKNGAANVSGAIGANATGTTLNLGTDGGGAQFFNGDLGAFLIYSGDKTSSFAAIEAYLKGIWGTP